MNNLVPQDNLVILRRNEAFTDSLKIAGGTRNQHNSVTRLIKSHHGLLEKFGKIEFLDLKSKNPKGGRPANEQQAF